MQTHFTQLHLPTMSMYQYINFHTAAYNFTIILIFDKKIDNLQ